MAETLSLVANILAVSELAVKVSVLGYNYISSVKRAPQSFKDLVSEIHSLLQVLVSLQDYAKANSIYSTALGKLSSLSGPLQTCTRELQELQLQLKPPNKGGFRGVMNLLAWPIKEGDTLNHIERIERCKTLFTFAMSVDQMSLSRGIEGIVQNTSLALRTESAAQSSWRQHEESRVSKEDARLRAETRNKVLDWLYQADSHAKHTEINNLRQRNTGGWILKRPQFQDWTMGKLKSRLLWGHGIPGAGKTFLSSLIIDHLQDLPQVGYGVAHVYFDYKEQERQKPVLVLSNLVKQLASQILHLPAEIEDLYNELEPKRKTPTLEQLYAILLVISKQFPQVFLVFDALDECHPENQRRTLLPLFQRMGKDGINVFLTSRPHPEDIRDSLRNVASMELLAQEEDIVNYIQDKIDENPRARSLVRQGNCKDRIISELVQCAKGMFLLVRFHVEFLCQQTSAKKILKALDQLKNLSTGERPLDPTYDRAIESIYRQHASSVDLALNILSWLVKAKRTLTVEELRVAVSVEPERYELDELDLPNRATLVDVCASLVVIDDQSDTIRLAHYTVQEYLLRSTIILKDIDFKLAMACTTYLSFKTFERFCITTASLESRRKSHPFLEYAAHYVYTHLRECAEDLTTDILLRLLTSPGNLTSYLQTYTKSNIYAVNTSNMLPLHVASELGHLTVTRLLLEKGADVTAKNRSGDTAMHLAAGRGHEAVVRLLLEKGANVSAKNHSGDTAMHLAAYSGHEAVVRLLLEKGADVSAKGSLGDTAMHKAVYSGHEAVVRLLLEKGADATAKNYFGNTAIYLAAGGGYEAAAQLSPVLISWVFGWLTLLSIVGYLWGIRPPD